METEIKTYNMVNVLRLLLAYLVVALHAVAFASFGDSVCNFMNNFLFRIAVPFFFITSGYFLYFKSAVKGYFKKYITKLTLIFLIITIIDSLVMVPLWYSDYATMNTGLLIKEFLINGVHGSLWYFPALIISSTFVYVFIKKDAVKLLSIISIPLLIIGLMGDSYYGLIQNTPFLSLINIYEYFFNTTRNGITFAVPFLTLGVLINKYKIHKKLKFPKLLLILSFILYGIEYYIIVHTGIAKDYNIYFSLIFVDSLIFITALNSNISLKKSISNYLREMSLWIYGFHGLIILLGYITCIFKEDTSSMTVYILVCLVTTIIAWIISFFRFKFKYKK